MSGFEAIFGVVTGGVSLVSLGVQLADSAMRLRRLYQNVKNAPKALNELSEKLDTMGTILHLLDQQQRLQPPSMTQAVIARCVSECERCSRDIQEMIEKMQSRIKEQKFRGRVYFVFKDQDIAELSDRLEKAKSSLTLAHTMQISMSTQYLLYQNQEQMRSQKNILAVNERVLNQLQARSSPDGQDIVVTSSITRTANRGTPFISQPESTVNLKPLSWSLTRSVIQRRGARRRKPRLCTSSSSVYRTSCVVGFGKPIYP